MPAQTIVLLRNAPSVLFAPHKSEKVLKEESMKHIGTIARIVTQLAVISFLMLPTAVKAQQFEILFSGTAGSGRFTFDTNRLVVTSFTANNETFTDPLGTLVFQGNTNLSATGVSFLFRQVNSYCWIDIVCGDMDVGGPGTGHDLFPYLTGMGLSISNVLASIPNLNSSYNKYIEIGGVLFGNYDSLSLNSFVGPPMSPSITAEPLGVVANAHDTVSFGVTASGSYPLTFQWMLNESNIVNFSTLSTQNSLTITNIKQIDLGGYKVIVTNAFGSVTSSVANLKMYPYLSVPFNGLVTYWGQTNTLSVVAWGSDLSLQWFKDGVAVLNATNSTLTLNSIQFTNGGSYSVIVSNAFGIVTNTPYQVIVNAADIALGLCPEVIINGTVGYNYVIQSSTDLSNTNSWITVTNLTLNQPLEIWADTSTDTTQPNNPRKFYRVLSGQ